MNSSTSRVSFLFITLMIFVMTISVTATELLVESSSPKLDENSVILRAAASDPFTDFINSNNNNNTKNQQQELSAMVTPNLQPARFASHDSQGRHAQSLAQGEFRIIARFHLLSESGKFCSTATGSVDDMKGGSIACDDDNILTSEKKSVLENEIVPRAISRIKNALQVSQSTSAIQVGSTACGNQWTIPAADQSPGVANADFVFYVASTPIQEFYSSGGYCSYSPAGSRPPVGRMNFGTKYIPSNWSALDPLKQRQAINAVIKSLFHGFGFHTNIYLKSPYTSTATVRGYSKTIVTTSSVLEFGRQYFGCSSITGVELETENNYDSNWESRVLQDEIMTGILNYWGAISNFTLKLFGATGVYFPNRTAAEEMVWGNNTWHGKECGFLEGRSGLASAGNGELCGNGVPCPFCDHAQNTTSIGHNFKYCGKCSKTTFSGDISPAYFQNFASFPKVGGERGATDLIDYAQNVIAFSNRMCTNTSYDATANEQLFGYTYESNARCVMSYGLVKVGYTYSSQATRCVEIRCYKGNRVQIRIRNDVWMNCSENGDGGLIDVTGQYKGQIDCPAADAICLDNTLHYYPPEPVTTTSTSTSTTSSTTSSTSTTTPTTTSTTTTSTTTTTPTTTSTTSTTTPTTTTTTSSTTTTPTTTTTSSSTTSSTSTTTTTPTTTTTSTTSSTTSTTTPTSTTTSSTTTTTPTTTSTTTTTTTTPTTTTSSTSTTTTEPTTTTSSSTTTTTPTTTTSTTTPTTTTSTSEPTTTTTSTALPATSTTISSPSTSTTSTTTLPSSSSSTPEQPTNTSSSTTQTPTTNSTTSTEPSSSTTSSSSLPPTTSNTTSTPPSSSTTTTTSPNTTMSTSSSSSSTTTTEQPSTATSSTTTTILTSTTPSSLPTPKTPTKTRSRSLSQLNHSSLPPPPLLAAAIPEAEKAAVATVTTVSAALSAPAAAQTLRSMSVLGVIDTKERCELSEEDKQFRDKFANSDREFPESFVPPLKLTWGNAEMNQRFGLPSRRGAVLANTLLAPIIVFVLTVIIGFIRKKLSKNFQSLGVFAGGRTPSLIAAVTGSLAMDGIFCSSVVLLSVPEGPSAGDVILCLFGIVMSMSIVILPGFLLYRLIRDADKSKTPIECVEAVIRSKRRPDGKTATGLYWFVFGKHIWSGPPATVEQFRSIFATNRGMSRDRAQRYNNRQRVFIFLSQWSFYVDVIFTLTAAIGRGWATTQPCVAHQKVQLMQFIIACCAFIFSVVIQPPISPMRRVADCLACLLLVISTLILVISGSEQKDAISKLALAAAFVATLSTILLFLCRRIVLPLKGKQITAIQNRNDALEVHTEIDLADLLAIPFLEEGEVDTTNRNAAEGRNNMRITSPDDFDIAEMNELLNSPSIQVEQPNKSLLVDDNDDDVDLLLSKWMIPDDKVVEKVENDDPPQIVKTTKTEASTSNFRQDLKQQQLQNQQSSHSYQPPSTTLLSSSNIQQRNNNNNNNNHNDDDNDNSPFDGFDYNSIPSARSSFTNPTVSNASADLGNRRNHQLRAINSISGVSDVSSSSSSISHPQQKQQIRKQRRNNDVNLLPPPSAAAASSSSSRIHNQTHNSSVTENVWDLIDGDVGDENNQHHQNYYYDDDDEQYYTEQEYYGSSNPDPVLYPPRNASSLTGSGTQNNSRSSKNTSSTSMDS